jgi:hypothetical protein
VHISWLVAAGNSLLSFIHSGRSWGKARAPASDEGEPESFRLLSANGAHVFHFFRSLAESCTDSCAVAASQVDSISATKARLLYNAGLTSIQRLSLVGEEHVALALAASIRNRRPMDARQAALRIGKTGEQGTNAFVARSAKQVCQGRLSGSQQVSTRHEWRASFTVQRGEISVGEIFGLN